MLLKRGMNLNNPEWVLASVGARGAVSSGVLMSLGSQAAPSGQNLLRGLCLTPLNEQQGAALEPCPERPGLIWVQGILESSAAAFQAAAQTDVTDGICALYQHHWIIWAAAGGGLETRMNNILNN